MGLIPSHSSSNRVIDQDLTVTYNIQKVFGEWTHNAGPYIDIYKEAWEISRYARKTYKYVGMSLTAARSCASDMITKFTRNQKDSVWDLNDDGEFAEPIETSSILMADVVVQHDDGCMYSVIVSVNETDTRMRRVKPSSASSLFWSENVRDYDT